MFVYNVNQDNLSFMQRERGDNGLFMTLVPKVLLEHFLIRWLNNFRELCRILIGWLINPTNNCNLHKV